ncbi:unnamed protein product [Danaus chrysippus]|uniref:(African queen) hypothetical protein n=1 Tax=Danaus chrysippus TaxID=151541 RepID=A0A8J2QPM1_9NEOP|nr:unnamed protein product [Danaus chrysippus]
MGCAGCSVRRAVCSVRDLATSAGGAPVTSRVTRRAREEHARARGPCVISSGRLVRGGEPPTLIGRRPSRTPRAPRHRPRLVPRALAERFIRPSLALRYTRLPERGRGTELL